jgi:hypothetical protein
MILVELITIVPENGHIFFCKWTEYFILVNKKMMLLKIGPFLHVKID